VVNRSIPPRSVAVGVPAKVIRTLDVEEPGVEGARPVPGDEENRDPVAS